jgi:hypothetical protein
MADNIEAVRIKTGMDFGSRILWRLGWNSRTLYIIGFIISLLCAISIHSPVGLLFGLVVLLVRWKATSFINSNSPSVINLAKVAVAHAGSKRVGVELETSDFKTLLIPQDSSPPFGIRPLPEYHISVVYICDAFFATYSGTSFSLADCTLEMATTGDEIYFRHVSAINYRGTSIEIAITRNKKPKLIEVGSEENGAALLEVLRAKLRNPSSPIQQLAASVAPPPPEYLERESITHTARNDGDHPRYCYIRSSKLMEYYSDVSVLTALLQQLQVPGTTATHNLMSPKEKQMAIEAQITHFRQTPSSFWYGVETNEVLAASIWRAGGGLLTERVVKDKFYDVAREEDLRRPVARWLEARNEEAYMEIQLGRRRIDVLGYTKRDGVIRLTAVELKDTDEEFRRGPDQMGSFAEYVHTVYLACTPAFAADYLERNAVHRSVNRWDASILDRKLRQGGFGLLMVERDKVFEVIKPVEQSPSDAWVAKVVSKLPALHKIELD